ncbi:VOC family protein [Hoeflea sp.]|uniref:VOC family protein n=1 Tax=Hoeflea sp. TaxID=1940281 RepID=UPI003B0293FB
MTLLHMSINAHDPQRVSEFLARILGGEALPFPPFPDCWIAFAGSDDGTAIEVYPLTHQLVAGVDQVECRVGGERAEPTFAHIALATPMPADEVITRAGDEGWPARTCNRGPFQCVEIWIEDRLLIEVLDPKMRADYRAGMTVRNWRAMFGMNTQ